MPSTLRVHKNDRQVAREAIPRKLRQRSRKILCGSKVSYLEVRLFPIDHSPKQAALPTLMRLKSMTVILHPGPETDIPMVATPMK